MPVPYDYQVEYESDLCLGILLCFIPFLLFSPVFSVPSLQSDFLISLFRECSFQLLLNPPLGCQSLNLKRTPGAGVVGQRRSKVQELFFILQLSSCWKITIKKSLPARHSGFLTGMEPVYKRRN